MFVSASQDCRDCWLWSKVFWVEIFNWTWYNFCLSMRGCLRSWLYMEKLRLVIKPQLFWRHADYVRSLHCFYHTKDPLQMIWLCSPEDLWTDRNAWVHGIVRSEGSIKHIMIYEWTQIWINGIKGHPNSEALKL